MAFGDSRKISTKSQTKQTTETVEQVFFNMGNGKRIFRMLPTLENGKVVAESDFRFRDVWLKNHGNARIFLEGCNPENENTFNPWENAYMQHVLATTEKGSEERKEAFKLVKQRAVFNVIDITPVLRDEYNMPVYPDENGKYCISYNGKRLDKTYTGTAQPNNKVLVFDCSANDPTRESGKAMDLLSKIFEVLSAVEDEDSEPLDPLTVKFVLITKGSGQFGTTRTVSMSRDLAVIDTSDTSLPRWDVRGFYKPYPDELINRVLEGETLSTLLEEYSIARYPQLITPDSNNVTKQLVDSKVKAEEKKGRGKSKPVEIATDDEEGLFP